MEKKIMVRTVFLIAWMAALIFTGCAHTVRFEIERQPAFYVDGISRIAVVPFKFDEDVDAEYGEMLALNITERITRYVNKMEEFTLVEYSEVERLRNEGKSIDGIVDALIIGNVTSHSNNTRTRSWYDAQKQYHLVNENFASVSFNYSLVRTNDESVVGTIYRRGSSGWSTALRGASAAAAAENAFRGHGGFRNDFFSYRTIETHKLQNDKSGDTVIQNKMESAIALVKAKDYQSALDTYLEIFEQYESHAAAYNASIIHMALFNDVEGALDIMERCNNLDVPSLWMGSTYQSRILTAYKYDLKRQVARTKGLQEQAEKADTSQLLIDIAKIEEQADKAETDTPLLSIDSVGTHGTFIDARDGKTYRTVVMPDGKTWMAENLNYRDSSWSRNDVKGKVSVQDKGSWCYDNNVSNCDTYGRLYTWNAAREACPVGWHLPKDGEWAALIKAIGGSSDAGTKLKSVDGWESHSSSQIGTNDYGFSAIPGGRNALGKFQHIEQAVYWWTSKIGNVELTTRWCITNSRNDVFSLWDNKRAGYSVRCVKD